MMHDCRKTQDELVDLMFDEFDAALSERVRAEAEACANCSAQYRSLTATLATYDEASAALTPRASYWPEYHKALTRRLADAASELTTTERVHIENVPFWKRLLTTSIRVPAPLAATALLLLVASSILALTLFARRASEPVVVVLAAPASTDESMAPQIKFIEVPVVQEKIVTQIIYAPPPPRRGATGNDDLHRRFPRENLAGIKLSKAATQDATPPSSPPRANLSGFKPADELNLRIIKESNAHQQ